MALTGSGGGGGGGGNGGKVPLAQFKCLCVYVLTDTFEIEPIKREFFVWCALNSPRSTNRKTCSMKFIVAHLVYVKRTLLNSQMMSATVDRKWYMEYEFCCKLHLNEGSNEYRQNSFVANLAAQWKIHCIIRWDCSACRLQCITHRRRIWIHVTRHKHQHHRCE